MKREESKKAIEKKKKQNKSSKNNDFPRMKLNRMTAQYVTGRSMQLSNEFE